MATALRPSQEPPGQGCALIGATRCFSGSVRAGSDPRGPARPGPAGRRCVARPWRSLGLRRERHRSATATPPHYGRDEGAWETERHRPATPAPPHPWPVLFAGHPSLPARAAPAVSANGKRLRIRAAPPGSGALTQAAGAGRPAGGRAWTARTTGGWGQQTWPGTPLNSPCQEVGSICPLVVTDLPNSGTTTVVAPTWQD